MKLTFRMKLLLGFVALVAAAELLTVAALDRSLSSELVAQLSRRLEAQARGSIDWISVGRHPEEIARRLSNIVDARVTVIDERGAVVGDSDAEARPAEERDAPEVRAAREGQAGRDTRFSPRLQSQVHYVAVPTPQGSVIRLAAPLTDVERTITLFRRRMLLTSVVVLALAVVLALVVARRIVRPLVAMRDAAHRIAGGNYNVELPQGPEDEFGDLSRSLKTLSAQLDARIGEIVAERDRLQVVLASMVEGVLVLDAHHHVELVNPSAEQLFGCGPLSGRPLAEFMVDAPLRKVFDQALAHRRGEAAEVEQEDGGRILAVTVQPLATGGAVAVLHDVTGPRRTEALRRQFVGDISHEIGTPLAAIQGYAETLLSGRTDAATTKEFLDIIHRHARRIGRLVDDLRLLSSLDAGATPERVKEPVALAELAHQVSGTVRPRAEERGTRVVLDVADDAVVLGDADHVERILLNLVDNAVKYGRDAGTVTVRARRHGERVTLEVSDDGPGIAPAHIGRVFDRFYRVDAGRSRDRGGTGLGLAIVKQLSEALGGSAAVHSDVGAGTRFTIELPAAASP